MQPFQVSGSCADEDQCPKVFVAHWRAYVQGWQVTDEKMLALSRPGADEKMVAIPLGMLMVAALRAAFHVLLVRLGVAR